MFPHWMPRSTTHESCADKQVSRAGTGNYITWYMWGVITWPCLGCLSRECHRLRRKLVGDRGMHHGTCVMHVPWCIPGSLTRGGGKNVPDIPGTCTTSNFMYLVRDPYNTSHRICTRTVLLYFVLLWLHHRFNRSQFTHIPQGCFIGIWPILSLSQCQRNNYEEYW